MSRTLLAHDRAQLRGQIRAALAIHRPCHTVATEPWGCEWGHYGDLGGPGAGVPGPDQPALCTACTYDDRTTTHPCPTALALGVPAPAPTLESAP